MYLHVFSTLLLLNYRYFEPSLYLDTLNLHVISGYKSTSFIQVQNTMHIAKAHLRLRNKEKAIEMFQRLDILDSFVILRYWEAYATLQSI